MSDDSIYFKTAAGEAAVRERTRLVQRNLRTVLILIDGLADVAALKTKAGDAAMVDAAVIELESMGLIGVKRANETNSTDASAAPPLTFEIAEAMPTPTGGGAESAPPPALELTGGAMAPPAGPSAEPSGHSSWLKRLRQRRQEAREEAVYDEAYGRAVDLSVAEPSTPEFVVPAAAAGPSMRLKREVKVGRMALLAALVAIVLAVMRVVFYPYEEYRPRYEEALTKALGEKVSIGNLRVAFLPMPVIMLEKVSVGDTPPHATADMVRLSPDLISLFADHRYRQVSIQGMNILAAGTSRLSRWFKPAAKGRAAVDQVDVENLWFSAGDERLGPLSGTVRIDPVRGIDQIRLGDPGRVRVEALPTSAGLSLTLAASNWLSPLVPPIKFSALEVKGDLGDGGFSIKKLEGLAYDGQFSGLGEIDWRDGARLTLQLELRHVAVEKLVGALEGPALLEGRVDAKLRIASQANRLSGLHDGLRADGSFTINRGQFKRIDLAEALKLGAQRPPGAAHGGTTGFEELEGNWSSDARSVRLTGLRMASGLMHASGNATVSRGAEPAISGSVSVALNGGSGVRATVAISGSALDPESKASR